MVIHESVDLDYQGVVDELDRLEADLLAQLKERKGCRSVSDPAVPSVAELEEWLIEIHGRKSVLRASRDPRAVSHPGS